MRRHLIRILLSLSLLIVFVLHSTSVIHIELLQRLENYTYDIRVRLTPLEDVDKRIVILDIDEHSLLHEGQWPWSRNKLAHMIDLLFDHYEIDVLGFDMVFAETDNSSGLPQLEQLAQKQLLHNSDYQQQLQLLRSELDYDQRFAESLANRRIVLGYYFDHDQRREKGGIGLLPTPILTSGSFNPEHINAAKAQAYTANLTGLQSAALTAGFFNASPLVDRDGVFRRISLLQNYDGNLYESLSLAVARLALRETSVKLKYEGESHALSLESILLGRHRIPADFNLGTLIPYRGKQGSFPYVSATELLKQTVPKELMQDAIVLLGTTAPGLMDLRTTPVQDLYPGVETHANLISGILDNRIKERPAYTIGLELVLLITLGLIMTFLLLKCSPIAAIFLYIGGMLICIGSNLYAWHYLNLVLPLASLLLMITLQFIFNMSYGYLIESRGKRLLAGLFGQYVPPELVAEMADKPDEYSLTGESREMTVLFSDVRGFTNMSEGLDPKQLTQLMNAFLTPMTSIIHQHRGTIDKYMGDAIMSFWGAPLPDANQAENALDAAIAMIDHLDDLNDEFAQKGWPAIDIGVGLNTGVMTVGNMGSKFRKAYTVMGDSVNLGSRLEGLTKEYGVKIIVSEFTKQHLDSAFHFRELDRVKVKGKDQSVAIFEPLGRLGQVAESELEQLLRYHEALQLYRDRQWDQATLAFEALNQSQPESLLFQLYLQRLEQFIEHPPESDWDGTFTFLTK
ncbi:CHASE2 domain-containing protein [Neptuniibacter sp.]|uniref:CHASE2 domain-containing protein n=1 Tax=Neptuniibacter sp. TaxID=1962643 RepID=UPI002630D163|nr:adenylate/guanylate cyclase domain-containing protein [Neptuniibacter sp.]MCP4595089.1 adenylate/guanylate cyclase domain-containing protein [Neptuniibacter sp.]